MRSFELPARPHVERRLDELVDENRFTIAVVFPAVGAITLLGSAEGVLPEPLSFNPYFLLFGVAVMRLPLIAGIAPLLTKRAAAGLLVLCGYTYAIEFTGVLTGYPYGHFEYGVDLGPMLAGHVPAALPLFFLPLVVNAYLLCLLLLGSLARRAAVRIPIVVAAVVGMDLVLDPAAVAVGFWAYDAGGLYYQVPWTNYAGWVLSATVSVVVLDRAFDWNGLLARVESCRFMLDDLVSFVILWGVVNAYFGNWLPALLAVGYGYGLWRTDRFDFPER
ncbi:bisanhydrobacterioruberin hydratase [Natronomonas pharaonis DSM 2160]|uniref:Bisanhydrobacterioruberin hydratase n=1 Tax=Natronomonas pharaonis (strain ATCC 35678 / DSM 2160 / CIP 103997 / JCM 8858 / NBRC 14720 / NCIMB 2260 / Gabara) TaxID=348780 RepID=A0A1U7EYY8_NATPD|nr:bisanhydrobacterioruberin hydratase [Natronomonas pharaonis]CAI50475.1 bisanhydrobacterioruberin hydratase [Natronomonas pharaonis DSM 2160]